MNIKQALKLKNKLVAQIAQQYMRMSDHNVHPEQDVQPYDSKMCLTKYLQYIDELVELKTKIHKANTPVYDKIFKMGELKSAVKALRILDCSAQRTKRYSDTEYTNYVAEISLIERDTLIATMESQIEALQEELDVHNSITQI